MALDVIFLDIDGVLNDHTLMNNGWCGIHHDRCKVLNRFLRSHPKVKIVLSSAWRYMVIGGSMTVKGFEHMLVACGLDAHDRLLGITVSDEDVRDREDQIDRWVQLFKPNSWIVLDDLDLQLPETNFVRTNANKGVMIDDVLKMKKLFDAQHQTNG